MRSAIEVIKEQISGFYLVLRISIFEMKSTHSNNYLGILWELINPMVQITIYWFVFGYGIYGGSGRADVNYHGELTSYFPWMLSGLIVWFFVNPSIVQGSKSIFSRMALISKMNFPMSVVPTFVIFTRLYQHLMLLFVVLIIIQFFGYPINIYYLQLPYFTLSTIVFLLALSLVTSTISTIVRDFQMLLTSVMRVLIYLSPFLWPPYELQPVILQKLLMLNPLYYLAEGYRASILGNGWYPIENWEYTLYFWALTAVLFFLGSFLHVKFRKRFIDYI